MAAASMPGGRTERRSLLGVAIALLHSRARSRTGRPSKLAAAIQNHALTFGAMAAIDVGLWHLGPVAGWVSVGVSILLADFKIQAG